MEAVLVGNCDQEATISYFMERATFIISVRPRWHDHSPAHPFEHTPEILQVAVLQRTLWCFCGQGSWDEGYSRIEWANRGVFRMHGSPGWSGQTGVFSGHGSPGWMVLWDCAYVSHGTRFILMVECY
jgi:hypothetical protein